MVLNILKLDDVVCINTFDSETNSPYTFLIQNGEVVVHRSISVPFGHHRYGVEILTRSIEKVNFYRLLEKEGTPELINELLAYVPGEWVTMQVAVSHRQPDRVFLTAKLDPRSFAEGDPYCGPERSLNPSLLQDRWSR